MRLLKWGLHFKKIKKTVNGQLHWGLHFKSHKLSTLFKCQLLIINIVQKPRKDKHIDIYTRLLFIYTYLYQRKKWFTLCKYIIFIHFIMLT